MITFYDPPWLWLVIYKLFVQQQKKKKVMVGDAHMLVILF